MDRPKKVAAGIAAAAALLFGTGIATALDDAGDTTAEGTEVADAQSKAVDHRQNGDDNDDAGVDVDAEHATEASDAGSESEGEGTRPTTTHGYEVSQLARGLVTTEDAEGRDHGEAVSTLASSNGNGEGGDNAAADDRAAPAGHASDRDGEAKAKAKSQGD